MKKLNIVSLIFVSIILSSCGMIDDEGGSDISSDGASESMVQKSTTQIKSKAISNHDDLFDDNNKPDTDVAKTDGPSNITITPEKELPVIDSTPIITEAKPQAIETAPIIKEEKIAITEPTPAVAEEKIIAEQEIHSSAPQTYKVQKGETLMQIAFKLYGDISRWKELRHMNGDKLSSNHTMKSHTELKYIAPTNTFVWKHEGSPHLIKTGETLGTISSNIYQTPKYWKKIWENNKPLIKNPNVIYAGFTLYYKSPAEMAETKTNPKEDVVEFNNIDDEINNIQSATEKPTVELIPLAE